MVQDKLIFIITFRDITSGVAFDFNKHPSQKTPKQKKPAVFHYNIHPILI